MAEIRVVARAEDPAPVVADAAPADAVLATLFDVFPDARILSPREQVLHDRPTQSVAARPSWYVTPMYGIWMLLWDAYRERRVRSSRRAQHPSARRRSRGTRSGNRRNGDGRNL